MRLNGKRAFITAAGQGIGRAVAEAMTAEGAHVVATDLKGDLLSDIKAAESFALDATDKDALQKAITVAKPDILVNCAGFVHNGTIADCTDEQWGFAFDLNCRTQFHGMQAALPGMVERGGGSIINVSSVASSIIAAPNRFVYAATKAAVIAMTKSVALDYVTTGVRCNCICPGTVDSPSLHQRWEDSGDYEAAKKQFIARQPMGRVGTPEEIAKLAIYLGSDESAFTTGHAHVIDGGWSVG
ncbi:SDR family oxidoreductase [Palleronia pelagia]|uniref:2-keto-3-deoxy-L-fuconate dehydrogenase n=1 Tax=Palleronia pelagia TaxID=387096 RepID=A0A1H8FS15_9RHOB|nr:SDR family oxidoreductase [Palleronia pelagia]SEN34482.1 2-keto-3-deoxy-L-fuconate dehydrogenase [Palleronia pelagia]